MALTETTSELFLRGEADWLDLSEVVWVTRSVEKIDQESLLKLRVLDVIFDLLKNGLMNAGEIEGQKFRSWSLGPAEAVARIRQRWDELGQMPGIGDVCWLANTAEGDRLAERLRQTRIKF